MSRFEVFHRGKRYWTHRKGNTWFFWSSRKWPFYHGHIKTTDEEDAYRGFLSWLPFDLQQQRESNV